MKKWEQQWDEYIPVDAIRIGVTDSTVEFAERFGMHLARNGKHKENRFNPKTKREEPVDVEESKLTSSQLRRFFGEVKRQQMMGYNESSFVLLKPKLAYAVGRVKDGKKYYKIEDLFNVLSKAIDVVAAQETTDKQKAFKNFISIFEAIVAYHKAAE
ncbi:MAG: type III-A CRISPR-associated protein Csm2 [Bacteroidaceae bacterium]|nr:type III-A CRISPR-associated protein Csm2 [Bacteroidaceae bacterium]